MELDGEFSYSTPARPQYRKTINYRLNALNTD